MSRSSKWVLSILIILAVIGLYYGFKKAGSETLDVEVYEIKRGSMEITVTATESATIEPLQDVYLSFRTSGLVTNIFFQEGDRLNKGDVIVELDDIEALAGLRSSRADLEAGKADMRQTEIKIKHAKREYNRYKSLLKKQLVSQSELERAEYDLQILRSEYNHQKAKMQQLQAVVDVKENELKGTKIKAPFTGILAKIDIKKGENASAGQFICRMIDDSELLVKASVDEMDSLSLTTGMEAKITVDALPDEEFKGILERISPVVTTKGTQNRTVEITVKFSKTSSNIKVGMSSDIEIVLERFEDVIFIPTHAILEGDSEDEKVVFVTRDGVVHKKVIETGESNFEYTIISEGLEVGDQIITSHGIKGLEPGANVNITSRYQA